MLALFLQALQAEPHINLTWAAFAALCVALGLTGTAIIFVINGILEKRLSQLLKDLNGTYVRTTLFQSVEADMKRELDKHEARLIALE
jgi:hypothetical protein